MTFEAWWTVWVRKDAKADAQKAWGQVIKLGHDPETIIAGTKAYVMLWKERGTDRQHIPLPASFLRGLRWQDEVISLRTSPSKPDLFSAQPTPVSWNGTASKLIAEIGEAKWQTWFASTELELGDPATIWARKPSQAIWIRNKYRPQLERILGVNEVRVEVR